MDSKNVDKAEGSPVNQALVIWCAIAFILSIVMCTFNSSAMVLGASFFAKFLAVIVGSVLGLVGAVIGDAIRKFARPNSVHTNGCFLSLIWIKVFWNIGPQVIGLGIGVALGCSLVLR